MSTFHRELERLTRVSTIGELLEYRALNTPDQTAYVFLSKGEPVDSITYQVLYRRAKGVASLLQRRHLKGRPVPLLFPSGIDYLVGFFGCALAGCIAIPLYPPRRNSRDQRISGILKFTQASVVLSDKDSIDTDLWCSANADGHGVEVIAIDEPVPLLAENFITEQLDSENIAFLQFTSGTTSRPKGVKITHRNILANEHMISQAFEHDETSTFAAWAPIFHDMGLIGNILQPLYLGARCVFMAPAEFIKAPHLWLKAISDFRAHTAGAPDFAYDLCTRRVEDSVLETLDLSHWRIAFNGAEVIHDETLERFHQRFSSAGFHRSSFVPCYGLAECTLLATSVRVDQSFGADRISISALSDAQVVRRSSTDNGCTVLGNYGATRATVTDERAVVSCGVPVPGMEIRIESSDERLIDHDREVGEILLHGDNVSPGYWYMPEETDATFVSRSGPSGELRYLRTGDLGYVRDGELFVTGRLKELIIVNGQNYYPTDIEQVISRLDERLESGKKAAFSTHGATEEQVVVVVEISNSIDKRLLPELVASIETAVQSELSIVLDDVVLIRKRSLPTTSSGKTQRQLCRKMYENDSLKSIVTAKSIKTASHHKRSASFHPEPNQLGPPVHEGTTLDTLDDERQLLVTLYRNTAKRDCDFEVLAGIVRLLFTAYLKDILQARGRPQHKLDFSENVFATGMDSVMLAEAVGRFEVDTSIDIDLADIYESETLDRFVSITVEKIKEILNTDESPHAKSVSGVVQAMPDSGRGENSDEPIELTSAQLALAYMAELEGAGSAFDIAAAYEVRGTLDMDLFQRAVQCVCQRHELLRSECSSKDPTRLRVRSGNDEQSVVSVVDLQGHHEIEEHISQLRLTPFGEDHELMYRIYVYRLGGLPTSVFFHFSHIIVDNASLRLFVDQIRASYAALVTKGDAAIHILKSRSYREYVQERRAYLASTRCADSKAFWKKLLDKVPCEPVSIGGNLSPSPVSTHTIRAVIDATKVNQIQTAARCFGVTPQLLMLGTLKAMLYRYGATAPFCVGTYIDQRSLCGFEHTVGYFVNPVVVPCPVEPGQTLSEQFHSTLAMYRQVFRHREYAYEDLLSEYRSTAPETGNALFNVLFNYYGSSHKVLRIDEKTSKKALTFDGFDLIRQTLPQHKSSYDLVLDIDAGASSWFVEIVCKGAFSEPWKMESLWQNLLASLLDAKRFADCPIESLPLTFGTQSTVKSDLGGAVAKAALLSDEKSLSHRPTVEHQIKTISKRYANHLALRFENESITYAQLDQRIDDVASHLIDRGVSHGDVVLVCAERSLEVPILLLGIMRAGACYLPVDIQTPVHRLESIIDDAAISFAITDLPSRDAVEHPLVALVKQRVTTPIASQELLVPNTSVNSAVVTSSLSSAETLAYIIYTSGSTGTPKGVCVTHAALSNFLASMVRSPGLNDQDTLLSITSIAFDISALEFYGPLVVGGTVSVSADMPLQEPEVLEMWVDRHNVTLMQTTPSAWSIIVDTWTPKKNLRVLSGGESLSVLLKNRLCSSFGSVWNMYGPTETTIWSACTQLWLDTQVITIGEAVLNTGLHILDKNLQPVPMGCIGQLYISGAGLSCGYLGRETLTGERFISHTFADGEPRQLYATGDLVRQMDECGGIVCLGRQDNQVKIRGNRIELEEIESVFLKVSGLRQACALIHEQSTEPCLVLFYLDEGKEPLGEQSLRVQLRNHLPEYAIPQRFIVLDQFPRTIAGKLDRAALAKTQIRACAPVERLTGSDEPSVVESIKLMWTNSGLAVDNVHARFYELGGHSILALKLTRLIRDGFGVPLSLKHFTELGSVHRIAAYVCQARTGDCHIARADECFGDANASLTKSSAPDLSRFDLTDVQYSYWIGRQAHQVLGNVGSHIYFEIDSPDMDVTAFQSALNRVIERHDSLRTVVNSAGQQCVLEKVPEYCLATIDTSDQEFNDIAEQQRQTYSHWCYDPSIWPLFHFAVVRTPQKKRLYVSFDLLAADGWSLLGIIGRELLQLYNAADARLPTLNYSFAQYMNERSSYYSSDTVARDNSYWNDRLDDFPTGPELPLRKAALSVDRPRFVRKVKFLDKSVSKRLKRLASEHNVSLSTVFLAAYARVLSIWSKNKHFAINVTLYNRLPLNVQIDHVVGDFTSLLLLEIDTRKQKRFEELLGAVQSRLVDDLDHRTVEGSEIARRVMQSRQLNENPYPVVFTSLVDPDHAEAQEHSLFEELAKSSGEHNDGNGLVYCVSQTPQVCLDHQILPLGDSLQVSWDYLENLFYPEVIDEMFDVYLRFLQAMSAGVVEDVELCRDQCYPLTQSHKMQSVHPAWLPTRIKGEHLLTGFFNCVAERPQACAITDGNVQFSYLELLELSLSVLEDLRQLEPVRQVPVAIIMNKGWEQAVAVIAVLMNDQIYVPISTASPLSRIESIVSREQIRTVLVSERDSQSGSSSPLTSSAIGEIVSHQIVVCHQSRTSNPGSRVAMKSGRSLREHLNSAYPIDPDSTAYVIYTSGSTGQPKGVVISHSGAINTIQDVISRFDIGSHDVVLALSDLSFDLSVFDLFGALTTGAKIVFPDERHKSDPRYLLRVIESERVSVWNSVPTLFSLVLKQSRSDCSNALESLRIAMLSGDWLNIEDVRQAQSRYPQIRLVSLGGATEASIWSIFHNIEVLDSTWDSIPYGSSLANQQCKVLDEDLNHCPVWVIGEIYISGAGLAKGYSGDEEKTGKAFFPHPQTGDRLYRTGDLGRYMADYQIEFLGRRDNQIKLSGYRIELGDIESTLESHPGVARAVVTVSETGPNCFLEAWVLFDERYEARVMHGLTGEDIASLPSAKTQIVSVSDAVQPPVEVTPERFSKASATGLLQVLRCIHVDGQVFGKYRYASAGGYYPVKTYISLPCSTLDGQGGLWWFNPQSGALERQSEPFAFTVTHADTPQVLLIGDRSVFLPIYGAWNPEFLHIEAGSMSALLCRRAKATGLQSHVCFDNPPADSQDLTLLASLRISSVIDGELRDNVIPGDPCDLPCELEAGPTATIAEYYRSSRPGEDADTSLTLSQKIQHRLNQPSTRLPITGASHQSDQDEFDWIRRRSYRVFSDAAIEKKELESLLNRTTTACQNSQGLSMNLKAYVYVEPDACPDIDAGIYTYHNESGELQLHQAVHASSENQWLSLSLESYKSQFPNARFFVYLVTRINQLEHTSLDHKRNQALFDAGAFCQHLEECAPDHRMGMCQIGSLDAQLTGQFLQLPDNEWYVHGLVGGSIDAEFLSMKSAEMESHYTAIAKTLVEEPDLTLSAEFVNDRERVLAQSFDELRRQRLRNSLKTHLADHVPGYMIPGKLHFVDQFALTGNGKIDRQNVDKHAIPEVQSQVKTHARPASSQESEVLNIWETVLCARDMSTNESFFDVGGTSVAMLEVHRLITDRFKVDLPVTDLFIHNTVISMSAHITSLKTGVFVENTDDDADRMKKATRRNSVRARRANLHTV